MIKKGFTLVEVLVAMSITSIALIAGFKAVSALADNASRQATVMRAQLCAENQLTYLRLQRRLPDVGQLNIDCMQAGDILKISQTIRPTPNPYFRRVEVDVYKDNWIAARLITIVGRN